MSTLVPERTLLFSPALAATIGLEEAILLHLLHDLSLSRRGNVVRGLHWFDIDLTTLEQLLPFWSSTDLNRISLNLSDKGVLHLDTAAPGDQLRYAFEPARTATGSVAATTAAKPQTIRQSGDDRPGIAPRPQPPLRPAGGATLLPPNWQPASDLLQLLALSNGIPPPFALDQVDDFVLYWRERGEVSHGWDSRFRTHVIRQWHRSQQQESEGKRNSTNVISGTGNIPAPVKRDWYPSEDALEILERAGVSREFIDDAIPEFLLYWRERGDEISTWNHKFVQHIRLQWARFCKSVEHEQEPNPISPRWQPSADAYDILRLANIDLNFAREQIPEFVLFWRDAGTPHRSWNAKFLKHVKYQWAVRHQINSRTSSDKAGFIEKHTDRSWRDGI